ncbi:MAG TPA: hypothetical protein VFS60_05600 [Thermoanaerobaculia bacterium]|nr:hypothetical protein [Thermoanaerobaculia bacterium]
MRPAPFAARRMPPLGASLAVVAALLLSACGGGDGAATAEGTTAATPEATVETSAITGDSAGSAQPCPAKLYAFADLLERLRRRLAVGLSYEQYGSRVKALRASYGEIPVAHLGLGCLHTTATPAERAFNHYIDAANDWGECLADAGCSAATIEPVLQRKWRVASRFLSEAR